MYYQSINISILNNVYYNNPYILLIFLSAKEKIIYNVIQGTQ